MLLRRIFVLLTLCAASACAAMGQDSRNVAEPIYPQICKILYAELTPKNGRLPDEPIERHYRDTDRITRAMANCPAGKSVVLHAAKTGKSVFLIGPLRLRAGITLVVDGSAAVWGSRDPREYDVTPGSCAILTPEQGPRGPGCKPLILAEDAPHSGIMGEGVIDGRGGAKLFDLNETWWELAHRAKVEDANQAVSRLLVVRRSPDFTLYRITLRNSPNCHVTTENTDGFTAWGVRIDTPKWARNTDGIDPQSGSTNISIINSFIRSGDDSISPKAASGSVTHMTVRNTHFYNGHGFGIGSQTAAGLSSIRVDTLSIEGADNGLRIKSDRSRGGLVEDVRFENVCMRNVINPIVFNPFYTTFDGNRIPWYRNILLHNVHALSSGPITLAGLDSAHKLEATLDTVTVDGVKATDITARHAVLTIHHGNLDPTGEDVRTTGAEGGAPYSCEGKFPPFEQNFLSPTSDELIPPEDHTFYVAADGTGDFYNIQTAINRVPATGGLVLIAPGIYRERVVIPQSHVTLRSANPDPRRTVIVFDLSRATANGPTGTATVRVRGDNFTAENLTIANDFAQAHKPDTPAFGTRALSLGGDRNLLHNVHLLGNQETFYLAAKDCSEATGTNCEAGRTYISHSYISGDLTFIYGDGLAYFDDCEIHSVDHPQGGVITGQGKHYAAQESGFVFRNARLTADANPGKVFLGRPFRDLATVIFLNPYLGPHIAPAGWRDAREGSGRSRLESAYFRLYNPSGPGAPTQSKQLTFPEAQHYTPREFLGGKDNWDPH
jgi:polygalacturonase